MILDEILKTDKSAVTVTEQNSIVEAAKKMREKHVGCVIVVDADNRVVGVVTDRDIAMSLALETHTPDSRISQVMTTGVDTISHTMTVHDVTRFMRTVDVKRLPVVDEQNRLVGVVSNDDIIALLAREMFDACGTLTPSLGHSI